MAYANVSQRRMVVEDTDGALRWGARAQALARAARRPRGDRLCAYEHRRCADEERRQQGNADAGTRPASWRSRHGLEEYAGRIFNQLAMWPVRQRSFALASERLREGLEYCSERGLDMWRLYLLALRARVELDLGLWEDAIETTALVLGDPRTTPVPRGWALAVLGGDPRPPRPATASASRSTRPDAIVSSTGEIDRTGAVAAAARRGRLAGRRHRRSAGRDRADAGARARASPRAGPPVSSPTGAGRRGSARSCPRERSPSRSGWRCRSARARRRSCGNASTARTRPRWRCSKATTTATSGAPSSSCSGSARGRRRRSRARRLRERGVRGVPARPTAAHAREPRRAHGPGAGGATAAVRGAAQRADRRASGAVRAHGRPSRLGRSAQARCGDAR